MIFWILAVLGLFVAQTFIPNSLRYLLDREALAKSIREALGGRDNPPPASVLSARAARALDNLREALPPFLALALLLKMRGDVSSQAILGAQIFFGFRVLYVPAYLAAIPGIRSTMWMGSWVGLILMLIELLAI